MKLLIDMNLSPRWVPFLATTHGSGPSVVQIRSDELNPNAIGSKVVSAVKQLEAQLQSGALVSVEPRRTKVRLLPL